LGLGRLRRIRPKYLHQWRKACAEAAVGSLWH
jgi:hypothetical protein